MTDSKRNNKTIYLVVGGAFLAAYFVLGSIYSFFVSTDFNYKAAVYFMKTDIIAMLAKILFILPATVFLTLYLLKCKINFRFAGLERVYKRLLVAAIVLVMIIVALSVYYVFQQTPITDDERTYEFQAKILRSGRIFAPPPPIKESFKNIILIIEKNRWTGHYPLGHPFILVLGMLLGSKYFFPILFSGAIVLLTYLICMELFGKKKLALLSTLLMAISPLFIFTSSTLLTHTSSGFFLGLFMLLFLKSVEQEGGGWYRYLYALGAGLSIGFVFNMRPLTAVGIGLPFAVLLLMRLFRKRRGIYGKVALMILGFSALLLVTLWYNDQLNGDYFKFPVEYYSAFVNQGHSHSLQNGFLNLSFNMIKLNAFLFGFPLGLLFILIMVFKKTFTKGDKICSIVVLSFATCYLAWWFPGVSDTGPVYYYDLLIPIVILSARGILFLHKKVGQWLPDKKQFVPVFLSLSILFSVLTFYPEKFVFFRKLTARIAAPYKKIESMSIHNAVVFIHGLPRVGNVGGYRMNSPDISDDIIYCHLLIGPINSRVINRFPDRNYYILSFNEKKESLVTPVSAWELANIK
jgi:hypothetical protein